MLANTMFNLLNFVYWRMAMPTHQAVDLEVRYFDRRKMIFFDLQRWFHFFSFIFFSEVFRPLEFSLTEV